MIGEILTWAGVGLAAFVTFLLYRSAERAASSADSGESVTPDHGKKKEEAA